MKGSGSKNLDNAQRERMMKSLPKKLPIAGVRYVVVVASGKGGVGKSTTAGRVFLYHSINKSFSKSFNQRL